MREKNQVVLPLDLRIKISKGDFERRFLSYAIEKECQTDIRIYVVVFRRGYGKLREDKVYLRNPDSLYRVRN